VNNYISFATTVSTLMPESFPIFANLIFEVLSNTEGLILQLLVFLQKTSSCKTTHPHRHSMSTAC